jgi:signal transduction histidine kinase
VRGRLLTAILSVAGIAIVLFGVPLAVVVDRLVAADAAAQVQRAAVLAASVVPAELSSDDPVEMPENSDGITLGLYDTSGTLVSGSGPPTADAATREALEQRVIESKLNGTRVVAVPVAANERLIGVIRAEQSTEASARRSQAFLLLLTGLAVAVLAVGAAIGFVLASRLARPVQRLRDAAVQLGDGDFTIDIPRSSVPELDQAAVALTATARRLDDLVARERAFAADASHQLRTPLTGLRATIETELEFPRADPREVLHEAISDLDRLERTISEILAIARTSAAEDAQTSITAVLSDIEPVWQARLGKHGRDFVIGSHDALPPVRGHAAMLRQSLDVLLDNAVRHGEGDVRMNLKVAQESVTITVSDDGPGFASAVAAPPPAGSHVHGLGLPLAHRLVAAMHGRLVISHSGAHPQIELVLQRVSAR